MGLIKPEAFMRCVVENLPGENTEFALQMILEKTFTQILAPYFTFERAVADSMFETVLGKLCQTEDRSRQRMLANYMMRTATTGRLDLLISWLSAEHIIDPQT